MDGVVYFVFNVPATTGIDTDCHTLSLHDALPICGARQAAAGAEPVERAPRGAAPPVPWRPRRGCGPRPASRCRLGRAQLRSTAPLHAPSLGGLGGDVGSRGPAAPVGERFQIGSASGGERVWQYV